MGLIIGLSSMADAAVVTVDIPDAPLLTERSGGAVRLEMPDYGTVGVPGQPRLPARIVAVAIPPGAEVQNVHVTSASQQELSGSYLIEPVSPRLPLKDMSDTELARYEHAYEAEQNRIYSRDMLWPESIGAMERLAGFRKYRVVDVQIRPVQYNPVTGTLVRHSGITVAVEYTVPENVEPIRDNSPRMEALARRIIVNYDEAQAWYSSEKDGSRSTYDMVIITTDALVDRVAALAAFETNVKGRTVYVVTVETIDATIPGTDLAQKMRTFLRERYPTQEWGIEDVLLVGHHSDVPMRQVEQDLDYGRPLTDFYFAELSNPDSVNWDSNSNGLYWDNNDAADFYSEVNVGRIPWSDPDLVQAICQRSMDYEMNDTPGFKNNILLMGSFFWENTDNAVLMEYIMAQDHMADWSSIRMYEQNSTVYSSYACDYELTKANVQAVWPTGQFGFANMAGHGSYQSVHIMGYNSAAFWSSNLCASLNNDYPAIVFSDACSTSDTSYTNLGQRMLESGAVGYVGATKVALGSGGWQTPADGSSQTMDFFFTDAVTSKEYSQGAAHQIGLIETYQLNGWYYDKYEIAEWNLWGNPDLGMGLAIGSNGSVVLDSELYAANDMMQITLRDIDLNENTGVVETVNLTVTTSGNDTETVSLTETEETPGVFLGTLTLVESNAVPGNNRLDVLHGQTITVTYTDADDGQGGVNVAKTRTAGVDGEDPEIYDVGFGRITSDSIEILWKTTEQTLGTIEYGETILDQTAQSAVPMMEHSVVLRDLTPCTYYYFVIRAEDVAGNTVVDDNDGIYFRSNTMSLEVFFNEPLTSDPGWTTEGMWAFGQPTGQGGEHGYPDPTSGFTGNNVYGYNLNGDYPNNSPAHSLTSGAIDCSDAENVMLSYRRWLGVEQNLYDHATVEISTDGSTFTKVWENPDSEQADDAWMLHEIDIADIADGQPTVYLRWVMGSTDQGWQYCGWNIDDITLTATRACSEPTPTPRPTATPVPPKIPATGIHLMMPDTDLVPGDIFDLTYCLRNGMTQTMTVDVFIALEVYGHYWFWPTWVYMEDGIAYDPAVSVAPASEMTGDVLQFTWPDVQGPAPGLFFYGLLLDSASGQIMGDLSWICWAYM